MGVRIALVGGAVAAGIWLKKWIDSNDLSWQARKYLNGAWGRYKRYLNTDPDHPEYKELDEDAREAAAEINEIRQSYDQDLIDFEAFGEVELSSIGHSFDWKPCDPLEEFN